MAEKNSTSKEHSFGAGTGYSAGHDGSIESRQTYGWTGRGINFGIGLTTSTDLNGTTTKTVPDLFLGYNAGGAKGQISATSRGEMSVELETKGLSGELKLSPHFEAPRLRANPNSIPTGGSVFGKQPNITANSIMKSGRTIEFSIKSMLGSRTYSPGLPSSANPISFSPDLGASVGASADPIGSSPAINPVAPDFNTAPYTPVTPPGFEHVPMSPAPAPSFPAPKGSPSNPSMGNGASSNGNSKGYIYLEPNLTIGNGTSGGRGTSGLGGRASGGSGGERGGLSGGYGGNGTTNGNSGAVGGSSNSGGAGNSTGSGAKGGSGSGSGNKGSNTGGGASSSGGKGGSSSSSGGNKGGNAGGTSNSSGGNTGGGSSGHGSTGNSGGMAGGGGTGGECCPVLLDLNGSGFSVSTIGESSKFVDVTRSGFQHRMAWAGAGTGVLVFDADGDGKISQSKEFAFVEWAPTANSDFEALRQVFDTNGNGKLDAGDAQWASFRVAVGDQLVSLDDLGITSIDLTPSGSGQTFADGSAITGTSTYTKSDGTTGTVGDAVLVVDANGYKIDESSIVLPNGSSVRTIHGYHQSGELAFVNEITTSADGLTQTTRFDDNGDGIFDRSQLIVQGTAADGTRTKTVSDFDADGALFTRTITSTNGDGTIVTTSLDTDGDSIANQVQIYMRHADGSSTTTTEELSLTGNLLRKVEVSASSDGLTKTMRIDGNGSGVYHLTIVEQTVANADGGKTKTESRYSADNTLISRTITSISPDGRTHTISYDMDGDGTVDAKEITRVDTDPSGNVSTEVISLNGDGTQSGQASTKLGADGQSRTSEADLTGDGVADLITTEVVTQNGSTWTETIESRSGDGTLLSRKSTVNDTDAQTIRIVTDLNGDGAVDLDETTTTGPDGTASTVTRILNRDGSLRAASRLSVSEDGLSRSLESDLNGDGTFDFVGTDVTNANADGSRTRTVQQHSQDGSLINQIVTETSSDGLVVVTREDINGDGVDDLTTTDRLNQNGDGSRQRTVTTVSASGSLLAETVVSQSSDRKTTTTVIDENGDGRTDRTIEERVNTDGSVSTVEAAFNGDGSLRFKVTDETSADRLRYEVKTDVDGDGITDFRTVETTTLSLDGSRVTVESDYAGTTLVSEVTTYVSGNGLLLETAFDNDGNGTVERYLNDSTALNADGSVTRTQSVLAGSDRSIITRNVTTKSANGLDTILSVDMDGDDRFDRVTQSTKDLKVNGSVTETTTVKSADNSTIFQSQINTSADGNIVTAATDLDGDGKIDVQRETTVLDNGSVSDALSTFDNQSGYQRLTSRSVKTISDDGFETRIEHDTDGNGITDYTDGAGIAINADGSRTETIWREERGKGVTEKTVVTTSADGLSRSIDWFGPNNVSRGSVDKTTTLNSDGSTVQSERFVKADGTLESLTDIETSADKLTTVMTRDVDGDGRVDHRADIQRQADGRLISTYTDFASDGVTVADRKTVTETADGKLVFIDYDTNGDGQFDARTEKRIVSSENGDVTTTTTRLNGAQGLKDRTTILETADGLTTDSRWDFDADGRIDRRLLDVTSLNNDGSTSRSVSEFDENGALSSRMESSSGANGLAKSTRWDRDGSGDFEQMLTDNTVLNSDGTSTRTVTSSKDGKEFSKTISTTSADGMSKRVVEEFSSLGLESRITDTRNSIRSDGAVIERVAVSNSDGAVLEGQSTTISADGRYMEIVTDANGDGVTDQKKTYVQHNDGSQVSVTTGYRNGIFKTYETSTTISADGLKIDTTWDEDGNGSIDRYREVINRFNIDGSSKSETTDRSSAGAILSQSAETISADGLRREAVRDLNGDGVMDVTEQHQTTIDGQTISTIINNSEAQQAKYVAPGSVYWQASVAARIERWVSADGLSWSERSDFDGNGTYEHVVSSERQIDGSVISSVTETNADGSLKASGRMVESSDGRTRILTKDIGNDGIVDEVQTSVSHLDGSTSWAKEEFSTTGALIQTTTETNNAIGKLSYRLVTDGLGRKTGELVFDTLGRSVYSLYDGATGQMLSQTSLDQNGVKISATLYDPLNKEVWSEITQTYSLGKLSSQNKTNDDGTTEKITYSQELPWIVEYADPLNSQSWASIKQTYSGGKLWIQDRVNDNGVKESVQYNTSNGTLSTVKHTDTLNVEAWSSISQSYSNGILTSFDRIWDDGARDSLSYNAQTGKTTSQTYYYANGKIREKNTFDGQTGLLTGRSLYEADGRVKENTSVYASTGTRSTTWYDTTNSQPWLSLLQEVNVYGQLTKQETVRDDNSKETWFYDPQNTQTWSSVVWQGNSAWQLTGKITYNDNGSRNAIFWDPTNVYSWKEYTQYFSTSGQLKKQVQINDDGTKEYWWWDVDNESPSGGAYVGWNYIYEKHNQAGQIIKKAIQWDYGNWTYPVPPVLLDLNGDGNLELTSLDLTGPHAEGGPAFDWDGDGIADQTAWVGANDGMLVIDLAGDGAAGADGKIDQAREIAFSLWKTEDQRQAELVEQGVDDTGRTVTDLEGLRYAFDTNGDNVFDASDERWGEFRVWRDVNQNGIADAGELMTMDEAGIRLINLLPTSDGAVAFADGSAITGTSTAEKTDGSSMLVGDATFSYRPSQAA